MKRTTKLTALLLGVLMAASVAMTACDGSKESCKEHTDANGDGKCDVCDAAVTESESESPTESESTPEETIAVSLTVKEQNGTPVSGAVMRIVRLDEWYDVDSEWEPMIVTADENGAATVALAEGLYRLSYDSLPENFLGATATLTVTTDMEPVALEVTNNTPDGSEEHPFFLGDESITMDFPANTSYVFTLFAGDRRSVTVENASAEIVMNGVTYSPDANGRVTVRIDGKNPEEHVRVTVLNKGDAQELTVLVSSELGSMDNPIVIPSITGEATEMVATIPSGVIMYYTWTADKDCTLKVTSQDTANNISLHNKTDAKSTAATDGAAEVSLDVKAGDVVFLHVAVKLATENSTELVFSVVTE